jgi:negative regulator of sigma E activity
MSDPSGTLRTPSVLWSRSILPVRHRGNAARREGQGTVNKMLSYPQWKVVQRWTTVLTAAAAVAIVVAAASVVARVFKLRQGDQARSRFENPPEGS